MKYLKVFEEAKIKWRINGKLSDPEDIEDIDDHDKDMHIIVMGGDSYYLKYVNKDGKDSLFDSFDYDASGYKTIPKDEIKDDTRIQVHDYDDIHKGNFSPSFNGRRWKSYRYKDLPEEIKNRII